MPGGGSSCCLPGRPEQAKRPSRGFGSNSPGKAASQRRAVAADGRLPLSKPRAGFETTIVDGMEMPLRRIKGRPETFDLAALRTALGAMRAGETLQWPHYDRPPRPGSRRHPGVHRWHSRSGGAIFVARPAGVACAPRRGRLRRVLGLSGRPCFAATFSAEIDPRPIPCGRRSPLRPRGPLRLAVIDPTPSGGRSAYSCDGRSATGDWLGGLPPLRKNAAR